MMLKAIALTTMSATFFAATFVASVQAQTRRVQPSQSAPSILVAPQTVPNSDRLAAPGDSGVAELETTCSGVQSCNDFIALCAATGGEFEGTAHNGQGQPTAGTCTTDD